MISKDTALYISIAQRPSNFGTTLFNAAFTATSYDGLYKAVRVTPNELHDAIRGIRALGIQGCGVSMPHKVAVMKYLDTVESQAQRIGAVNTIVHRGGRLRGYNTDYQGALPVLKRVRSFKKGSVLLLGDGGVAQAISCALRTLGAVDVTVSSRGEKTGRRLVKTWQFEQWVPWRQRARVKAELLINATSVGMSPKEAACPISVDTLAGFSMVMDVVVSPPLTRLLREAKKMGLKIIPGYEMSLEQALSQYSLYTAKPAPRAVMSRALGELLHV